MSRLWTGVAVGNGTLDKVAQERLHVLPLVCAVLQVHNKDGEIVLEHLVVTQ